MHEQPRKLFMQTLFIGVGGFGALTLQPLLFWKKQGFFPKKARVSLFAEPLKSLEKEGKTQEKARKIKENEKKKQGNRKKQGLEGQGGGFFSLEHCTSLCERFVGALRPATTYSCAHAVSEEPKRVVSKIGQSQGEATQGTGYEGTS